MFCTLLKILHKIVKSCKGEWDSTKISVTMLNGASQRANPNVIQCKSTCNPKAGKQVEHQGFSLSNTTSLCMLVIET